MCGLAGVWGPAQPDAASRAAAMALLQHRGPDAEGGWHGMLGGAPLTLLHTRLAILDLDRRADQPFARDGLVLAYNGEVYDFVERRAELVSLGHRFTTTSDTEVLLEAWRRWGAGALDRMEGMWALALADLDAGTLTLARDRFGEKPLFWAMQDATLFVASEVKVLAALGVRLSPDHAQVKRFLVNGYRVLHQHGHEWFREVAMLPAASVATLAAPAAPAPRRYWTLPITPRPMPQAEAVDGVRAHLARALSIRLRADVPVAFCLSGGVDSATLACLAAKRLGADVRAFSIVDRDPRYDESEGIAAVAAAIGTVPTVIRAEPDAFLDRLAWLVAAHDAPVPTISYYLHAFLSAAIARAGCKVAISGTGADELFSGYYDHYGFWLAGRADRPDLPQLLADWRGGLGRFVRNPVLQDPLAFARDPSRRDHITAHRPLFDGLMSSPLGETFAEHAYVPELLRNRMLNELHHEVVPVILRADDLNSMAHGIENRSPYLDRALAEFLGTVPSELLLGGGFAKRLLREAGRDLVPDAVRLDPEKRGFNGAIDSVLDRTDPQVRARLMADGPIWDMIDRARFETFLDHDATANSVSKFLFAFVSARTFLDGDLARGRVPAPIIGGFA